MAALPFARRSADHQYLVIGPGVESIGFKLDGPVEDLSADTLLALETGTGRFVTRPLPSGAGDVIGPAGATDNALARFDGATGILIQNSAVTLSDGGGLAGVVTLNGAAIPATLGDVTGPGGAADNALARYDGASGKLIQDSAVTLSDGGGLAGVATLNGAPVPATLGDVTGPGGATDNALARYDGASGKLIQDSAVTLSDAGDVGGVGTLAANFLTPSTNAALELDAPAGSVLLRPNAANAVEILAGQGLYAGAVRGPAGALTAQVNGVNPLTTSNTLTAHVGASTNVHGVGAGNSVVGTGTAQALTNKTISTGANSVNVSAAGGANLNTLIDQDVSSGSTPTFFAPTFAAGFSMDPPSLSAVPISKTINAGATSLGEIPVAVGSSLILTIHVTIKTSAIPGYGEYLYSGLAYNNAGVVSVQAGALSLKSEAGAGFANAVSFSAGVGSIQGVVTTAVASAQTVRGWQYYSQA